MPLFYQGHLFKSSFLGADFVLIYNDCRCLFIVLLKFISKSFTNVICKCHFLCDFISKRESRRFE